jgi:hypothetical protein
MRHLAATPSSKLYESLRLRERKYLAYDLAKPK